MNKRRAKALLKTIQDHKTHWTQDVWHGPKGDVNWKDPKKNHCHTQHCVAGFAQLKERKIRRLDLSETESMTLQRTARYDAINYLDITWEESEYLFNGMRTWGEVKAFLLGGGIPENTDHVELL